MLRGFRHAAAVGVLGFVTGSSNLVFATTIIAARSPSRIILIADSKVALSEGV
jgi:hypothetical protein